MKRVPILASIVAGAAILIMVGLGLWQLQRMAWKETLLERYAGAQALSSDVPWPRDPAAVELALFRHTTLRCDEVVRSGANAGRSAQGESGWAQTVRCKIDGGGEADIALGWSRQPRTIAWSGGTVGGFIAPGGADGARLIAAPPQAGLAQLAMPDPRDIPNNHFAYAVQWFIFAAVAALIYVLAVRKRLAGAVPPG